MSQNCPRTIYSCILCVQEGLWCGVELDAAVGLHGGNRHLRQSIITFSHDNLCLPVVPELYSCILCVGGTLVRGGAGCSGRTPRRQLPSLTRKICSHKIWIRSFGKKIEYGSDLKIENPNNASKCSLSRKFKFKQKKSL